MPRPSKFDAPTVSAILDAVRAGLPLRLAAEANGVTESTFHRWQRGEYPRGADPALKRQFSQELTRAKAQAAVRLTNLISTAAAEDWKAASWLLERRFPEHFAKDASLLARLDALERAMNPSVLTPIRRVP
jgi:hypothetical protein